MSKTILPAGMTPRLLSRGEAAAYLGVSPDHFADVVPVPSIKVGRRILWDIRALDAWVDGQTGMGKPSASTILSRRTEAWQG